MATGLLNHVGLGVESNYGTSVAPTVFVPIKESDGIQINKDVQFVESIQSGIPGKNKFAFNGKTEHAGGYDSDLYTQFIGHILRSALGSVSSELVYGESTVYEHTFIEGLTKPSYTIEQKVGEIVKRYAGFVARNIKIEGKVGEGLTFAFEGIAQKEATETASTPTYETPRPFNFADVVSVKIGSSDVLAQCEEFSIEYDNGVEGVYALGDTELKVVMPKQSEAKGKMTLYLDDTTKAFLVDYIAQTNRAIEIQATGDAIGTLSKNGIGLYLPKCAITTISTKLSTDYNVMEVEFEGIVDPSSGLFSVDVTNTLATYTS